MKIYKSILITLSIISLLVNCTSREKNNKTLLEKLIEYNIIQDFSKLDVDTNRKECIYSILDFDSIKIDQQYIFDNKGNLLQYVLFGNQKKKEKLNPFYIMSFLDTELHYKESGIPYIPIIIKNNEKYSIGFHVAKPFNSKVEFKIFRIKNNKWDIIYHHKFIKNEFVYPIENDEFPNKDSFAFELIFKSDLYNRKDTILTNYNQLIDSFSYVVFNKMNSLNNENKILELK